MTTKRSLENIIKSMLYEDQAHIGSYRTKNFDIAPEALELYSKNFDKTKSAHYGEKMAIFQDKIFDIVRKARKEGFATESDKQMVKELKDKIDYLADLMGMKDEHSYVDKYVSEIVSGKLNEPTKDEPSTQSREIDSTGDNYHVSRNRKMQHHFKIMDEETKKPYRTMENKIREVMAENIMGGYDPRRSVFDKPGTSVPVTRLSASNHNPAPKTKKPAVDHFKDWHDAHIAYEDGASLTHTSAYESYCENCDKHGHEPHSFDNFRRELMKTGVVSQKIAGRVRAIGVKLRTPVSESLKTPYLKPLEKPAYKAPSNLDGVHDRIREIMADMKKSGQGMSIDPETKAFHDAVFQGRIDRLDAARNRRLKMGVKTRTSNFDVEKAKLDKSKK